MDSSGEKIQQQLLLELESLEHMGITIWMDGIASNASNTSEKLVVNEVSNYMRDYVLDDGGRLKELRFDRISIPKK